MTYALVLAELGKQKLKAWWKDAVSDRVAWLWEDFRNRNTCAWDGQTAEWLAAPRRKIGSAR
jgi:hypothetical protein